MPRLSLKSLRGASIIESPPSIASSKPRFIVRWRRCQFALPAKPPEPGLRTVVSEHVGRKIAVALLAAPIVPGLKSLLDLVGLFGNRFNKIMRLPTVVHAVQSLAQQSINGGHRVFAEIELVEADHLDAETFQHLLPFEILCGEIRSPATRPSCITLDSAWGCAVVSHRALPRPLPAPPPGRKPVRGKPLARSMN